MHPRRPGGACALGKAAVSRAALVKLPESAARHRGAIGRRPASRNGERKPAATMTAAGPDVRDRLQERPFTYRSDRPARPGPTGAKPPRPALEAGDTNEARSHAAS